MGSGARPVRLVAACLLLAAAAPVVGVSPAVAAPSSCPATAKAGKLQPVTIAEEPYAQRRFKPQRLAELSTGRDVTVAVLDSGVDDRHPQLKGQVLEGRNFLAGPSGDTQDCNGHGTGVASIIAARKVDGIQFQGLAPDAKILPVRVSETEKDTEGQADKPQDPLAAKRFADAIQWAAQRKVKVMNVSLAMYSKDPDVQAAIKFATDNDVVVVAAAGNFSNGAVEDNKMTYPAAFEGVLGVGAIDENGLWQSFSQYGPWVALAAPGNAVLMAAPGGKGHQYQSGTSFATPYVAATAALVRARFPDLDAERVIARIIATADPAPGGARSDRYGYGIVNPYRALADDLPGRPQAVPAFVPAAADPVALARAERRAAAENRALVIGGIGLVVAVAAGMIGVVVPRGVRRRWRPAGPADADQHDDD